MDNVNRLMPANLNMTLQNGLGILQGADWYIATSIIQKDSETKEEYPFDLTGYTGKCTIKKNAGDKDAIVEPVVTITDAENGEFSITLSSDITATIPTTGKAFYDTSLYQYDVYFIDENENRFRALEGYVSVSPTVTDEDD